MSYNKLSKFWGKRIAALLVVVSLTMPLVLVGVSVMAAEPAKPIVNQYWSKYSSKAEADSAAHKCNEEICNEGIVLLKNNNNALPLAPGAKISLFGKMSAVGHYRYLSQYPAGQSNGIQNALVGAGFQLNPTLVNFYADDEKSGAGPGTAPSNGSISPGFATGETPVSSYTPDIEASYDEYGDAALILISRISGEGYDLPRTMMYGEAHAGTNNQYKVWGTEHTVPGARSKTDHYLQLDQNEADLMKYVGSKFDKVVVILNTGSQFEVGFLDDPLHYGYHENLDAALWIGYPGDSGSKSLAKILKGEVNPSGKTVDTWARDYKTDPVWQNFGNNLFLHGNKYDGISDSTGFSSNFIKYEEGIYVGYRYWETRGYTEGLGEAYNGAVRGTDTQEWDDWYDAHVVYPLGYGLSYTSFSWELVSALPASGAVLQAEDTITVEVKVTNIGNRAGKDVVQLYYTAPYITGEIEKAHVVLSAFEKTRMLEPAEHQTLTLKMKVRDMASYDYNDANNNGFSGYELDAGSYQVRLMRNAHTEEYKLTYTVAEGICYDTDDVTGNKVENRFDEVSNYITEELGNVYLSRENFENTFPAILTNRLAIKQWIIDGLSQWVRVTPADDVDKPYYTDDMPLTGDGTGAVKLDNLIGLSYDDPLWEEFLNQWTVEDMITLVSNGSYGTQAFQNLGVPSTINADAPHGWCGPGTYMPDGGPVSYANFASTTVLASTWNRELAYGKGVAMANQALYGNGLAGSNFAGWYAPAINIHRSPFSGRNFEYYSEDGFFTGIMAAETVKGAMDNGLVTFVKHFGLNDQETNRVGLITWANEQSMREIYFKAFEVCIKESKTTGVMSALNRIGPEWAGGSHRLLTQILRDEWGFRGAVVTDTFVGPGLSNADQMIRAGGDLALGNTTQVNLQVQYNINSATTVRALRNATHNICYAFCNSMAMNKRSSPFMPEFIKYSSAILQPGIVGVVSEWNLGTATLAQEEFDQPVDNSLISYTIHKDSQLPAGLTLHANGLLQGAPEEVLEEFKFTVVAQYQEFTCEAEFVLSTVETDGGIFFGTLPSLDNIVLGEPLTVDLGVAYVLKPDAEPDWTAPEISYTIKNGSILPSGLSLTSDGLLTGVPDKECIDYPFTIVANAEGFYPREASLRISVFRGRLILENNVLSQASYGTSYLASVAHSSAQDKSVLYTLKDGSSLPRGLSLTPQGYIVGTPLMAVTDYKFIVVATADYYLPAEAEFSLTVAISFSPFSLPDGVVGGYYDATLDMAQGAANIKYALKDGSSLPEGLTLSESGELSGTPSLAGVYTFTVTASAEGYVGDEITLQLYIEDTVQSDNTDDDGKGWIYGVVFGSLAVLGTGGLTVILILKKKKA
jgi:beta-glucosidase